MLTGAKNEILETTANTAPGAREIAEPVMPIGQHCRDGIVTVRATNPYEPAGFETSVHFAEMVFKIW